MNDPIEQAKDNVMQAFYLGENMASADMEDFVDALIAAVRAEAQREAFVAGWDASRRHQQDKIEPALPDAFAVFLTRQARAHD